MERTLLLQLMVYFEGFVHKSCGGAREREREKGEEKCDQFEKQKYRSKYFNNKIMGDDVNL
jgi:hypothetical protein